MAKKKKQRVKAPAMSSLDKGIYYFLIGCSAAAAFFAAAFIIGAYRQRVFADARILAQENTGVAILFFLGMFLGGGMVAIFDWLRRKIAADFRKGQYPIWFVPMEAGLSGIQQGILEACVFWEKEHCNSHDDHASDCCGGGCDLAGPAAERMLIR